MSTGSIQNPSIAIQPSKKLVEFIKTLNDPTIALPENLLQIYRGFTSDNKEREIDRRPVPQPEITTDDKKLLQQLNAEKSTVDLETCLKNLAVIGAEEADEDNDSTSDIDSMPKEKKFNSKNQARRERAKQKETDRSKLSLNLNDLRWLNKHLTVQRAADENVGYLHELLEGSKLVLPQNEIIERNPVLEARCVRLRRQQDERVYKTMTKNVDCSRTHAPDDTISYQMKQINRQLIAVLQFICSVLAGFAFGFVGIELMIGTLDFGFRLLLGIICALVIALAEIYFLAKRLNEDIDYEEGHQNWLKSKSKLPSNVEDVGSAASVNKSGSDRSPKEHVD